VTNFPDVRVKVTVLECVSESVRGLHGVHGKLLFEFVYIGIVYGLDLRDDGGREVPLTADCAKCLHEILPYVIS